MCAFVVYARRTLCDPTWRNTSVQMCPNPDISLFNFDHSLNPSPRVNACRLNICLCNGYSAMRASSIKSVTVQDSVPANVKPTSCTLNLLWTGTTTLCSRACVRADATLVVAPPTVSHLFFSNTEQSRRTTLSRGTVHINSAGEEEAPYTNASHACTGSLLKRALNNSKNPAPGTPQVLEAHHRPSSRRPKAQDPLIGPRR